MPQHLTVAVAGAALRLQVLQTLYSCQPFRERLLQYAAGPAAREAEETILSCLADLFLQVPSDNASTSSGFFVPCTTCFEPESHT